jgi:tetratricopeptide (TPR) repeat protein
VAVLLDNAWSAAQVRPLLPSSGRSVAVITSRWRLSGLGTGGGRFIEVDPLGVADSVTLLRQVVGDSRTVDEHTQAEELARLCGGMPIALSVVGARLSARPRRSLSKEVGDLRQKNRLAALSLDDELSVGVVFDVSYGALPDEQARLYRLCALHPGPTFGVDVAAAMSRQPVDEVEPVLDGLVERNLLNEIADRRYRYHDLLRVHAGQQAGRVDDKQEADIAVRGAVEWYLGTTVAAGLAVRPTRRGVGSRFRRPPDRSTLFQTYQEALRWLERERGNLVQAARSAIEHRWDDLVWEFCEALWPFRPYVRVSDWLDLHHAGVAAAHRLAHRVAEALLRAQLGSALNSLGRYDEAMAENRNALRLAEETGDDLARSAALAELAVAARGLGDLPVALDYFEQTLRIREVVGTRRAFAQCQRQIGEVLADLRRYEEAVGKLTQAVGAVAHLDTEKARALVSLGTAYLRWGRVEDASTALIDGLAVATELESAQCQADALTALGDLAELTSDPATARTSFERARELYSRIDNRRVEDVAERLARLNTSRP